MKWFLITLAIGLAATDKLDRTYLPPPGAQHAGGNLGDLDAPLEPPSHDHSGSQQNFGGPQTNFGVNGEPVNFGDKIPKVPFNYYPEKVPTTTTSFAFSQTTYPPVRSYETTALPINPETGLPVQLDQANYPSGSLQGQQNVQNVPNYSQNQGQNAPTYGANFQPDFVTQSPTSAPVTFGSTVYDQFGNQPSQYPGQNVITPGGSAQIPGSVYPAQNQGNIQYPGQGNTAQQGLSPTSTPGSQEFGQYPGQNVATLGGKIQIPGGNQGLIQYPGGQTTGDQGFVPSTVSPINLQPGSNQYSANYDYSQGPISQGTYTGQPINVQDQGNLQLNQGSYRDQEPFNVGNMPSQYPTGNQNLVPTGPIGSENIYRPGSTSTIPSSYYNGVPSTTPNPSFPSSTSAYSTIEPVYRPERPQAAADRNAVILKYENIRTPNGYSYSFDTSNGIHADESGIVDNGTKAQGAYSYTGDDGKVYSVIYTADENGFQPRGDHLPTPPPIPEAIQRVIEQAARDKAAGIIDDGSYDEAKYGDKKYRGKANRRRPQNKNGNKIINTQFDGRVDDQIKPITGIIDNEHDEVKDQFGNMFPSRTRPSGKLPAGRPSNQMNGKNDVQDTSEANRRTSGKDVTPYGDVDKNTMPRVEDGINQYDTKDQDYFGQRPTSDGNNLPFTGTEDANQKNKYGSKFRRPTGGRPNFDRVKNMKTKYPGPQKDYAGTDDYSESGKDGFNASLDQDRSGKPSTFDGSSENAGTNFDSVTGSPIAGNGQKTSRQRVKGNRRPGTTSNIYTQNQNSPQGGTFSQERTEKPLISDFINNAANQPSLNQVTQQDEAGYYYQPPNMKFEKNDFPSRFSPQKGSSITKPDLSRTEFVLPEGTTRRPYVTPNVYNQDVKTSQSTTRRPFTTVGVTSPTENSYTDYEDGDDYETDQDNNDDRIDSTRPPDANTGTTTRPYQSTQFTSRPQYVNQNGTPGNRVEYSGTSKPGYAFGSTTPMPSHSSRFGNTESPRGMKPQQDRPLSSVSSTAVGRPVTSQTISGTRPSDYQTTIPTSEYSGPNVASGYPATGVVPGFDSFSTTPGVSPPQSYSTSTYRPSTGFSSIATVPPTPGYKNDLGSQNQPQAPEASQLSPTGTFHTGYHYVPPRTGYSTTTVSPNPARPGSNYFVPSGISGILPSSQTDTYQTTYPEGPGGILSTTTPPGRPDTFIGSQPGYTAPVSSPFGTYKENDQNGPSKPEFPTAIVSSIPEGSTSFGYPELNGATYPQPATGLDYGSSRPTYSTESPPTSGTTPGSFIPSGTVAQGQSYPTTYGPGFQTTKDTFSTGPVVDGFGRPINIEQGNSPPGFSNQIQDSPRPGDNGSISGTEQTTLYPGSYDKSRDIGEDFSGPKQPQRYDPKTGYHYK